MEKYEADNPDLIAEIVASANRYDDDIRIRYFILKAEEIIVVTRPENAAAGSSLTKYCRDCLDFCKTFEDATNIDWSDFEKQKRFSEKFLACVNQNGGCNRPGFITNVSKCKGVYEPFDSVIDEVIQILETRGNRAAG